jgi:VCBS repeat protein
VRTPCALVMVIALAACGGEPSSTSKEAAAPTPKRAAGAPPLLEPLEGGPYPSLLVTQAQFTEQDGKPVPGPAKLLIVRKTPDGWKTVTIEDPDSNVFHKAIAYETGILTIGATKAALKAWIFANGIWNQRTIWQPTFGGKFDRLRDIEVGDVDHDGQEDLVIATHDQGVIGIVHPFADRPWSIEEIDRQPDTFVHEIEIGDMTGDGKNEFFATPSKPNKLDEEQSGQVKIYRKTDQGWSNAVVAAPSDTHAKEILVADLDHDKKSELYIVWEGAIGKDGKLERPVKVEEWAMLSGPAGAMFAHKDVGEVPDRQMRVLAAGDVNGDGKTDLVGSSLKKGIWLFEKQGINWKVTNIDENSSGYEHPLHLADLDGDGQLEIYVGAEDQGELNCLRWKDGKFEKTVVIPLNKGDITWNITDGRF